MTNKTYFLIRCLVGLYYVIIMERGSALREPCLTIAMSSREQQSKENEHMYTELYAEV